MRDAEEYKAKVEDGRRIVKQMAADRETAENHKMKLGELADGVAKVYSEGRLERYAKDIGMPASTLKRCRSVYRAWYGEDAPKEAAPPESFSVAQELQAHPGRFDIIKQKPDLTAREARRKTRQYNKSQTTAPDWLRKETKSYFQRVLKHAGLMLADAERVGGVEPKVQQIWREEIGDDPELVAILREACEAGLMLADCVEEVLRGPPPIEEDDFDAADPSEPPSTEETRGRPRVVFSPRTSPPPKVIPRPMTSTRAAV
jgi:hypothetical protein